MSSLTALLRATHPAPTAVVSLLAMLLAIGAGHGAGMTVLITLAVLTGQLTIGWSNDLLDAQRDRAVGRRDKPLATGELSAAAVVAALATAGLACLLLSLALGWRAGLAHLVLVGAGWAYNAGAKSTLWSWLPYGAAFGALPAIPWLAADPPMWPPWWMLGVGALLGIGAHLVNALPDLADDLATGVRGLPHRLGRRGAPTAAVTVLLSGTVLAVLGPPGPAPLWAWVVLAGAVILAAASIGRPGRVPFYGAMGTAVLNVIALLGRAS